MVNYELLQELRKKKKWSYKSLSKKLDCPVDIIKMWETGEITPDYNDLVKLAYHYNIDVKDLYLANEEDREISILKLIILFIVGCVIGIFTKEIIYLILLPILNIMFYLCLHNLSRYERNKDQAKSLFGFSLKKEEKKIYFYESNIIAIIYTYIAIAFRVLNIQILVPDIKIVDISYVNTFLIIVLEYLLLMLLSFIIELAFGLKIKKEYKE